MATVMTSTAVEAAARLVVELATGAGRTSITAAVEMTAASFDTTDDELWELIVAGDAPGCWPAATVDPATPSHLLERIVVRAAACDDEEAEKACMHAAGNAASTDVVRWTLLEHPADVVRCALAESPHTDLALLQALARDPDPDVCAAVAEHRNADGHIRRQLATHADPDVRAAVVVGARYDPDVLGRLLDDPVEAVRVAVAETTPILAHLDVLAADASPSVREAVAGNSAASYDLLIRLSNDTYDFVATAARRHM